MIDLRQEDLLIKAMTALDLAFVAWMRRRRDAGRAVTRDEFEAVATRATALDNAGDVDGIGALTAEVDALDVPSAEYLATWASVADEIVTKGITIGRTTARGNTMPVLAELVVHSCQRDSFGPDGDGVVLVDDGDGWRRLADAEHEAWTNALREAWQARIEPAWRAGGES